MVRPIIFFGAIGAATYAVLKMIEEKKKKKPKAKPRPVSRTLKEPSRPSRRSTLKRSSKARKLKERAEKFEDERKEELRKLEAENDKLLDELLDDEEEE